MTNDVDQLLKTINFPELPQLQFKGSFITVGNFDGVHLGHQAILTWMKQKASREKQPIIVVTFFPNPSDYFRPKKEFVYLSTPAEKEAHLLESGVDIVITFRFDYEFSELTAVEFLRGLKQKLGLGVLVVGRDFVLGKDRQGTIPVIKSIGQTLDFSVETMKPVQMEGDEISSTKIRHRLDKGDVSGAATLLGRHYEITGEVTHGSDRGARIGLPTANISHWQKKKLPAVGVYATRVFVRGNDYQGITNIGVRPTFEDQSPVNIETHILDFDGNIYGEKLQLKFIQKIRDEQKFSSLEAFLAQIERDKATGRRILSDDKI